MLFHYLSSENMHDFLVHQLKPWGAEILKTAIWLAALAVIFAPLERLFPAHPQRLFRKGILVDVAYYFLNSLLPALMLSAPLALLAWGVRSIVPNFILESTIHWPLWGRMLAGMLAGEIGYYWGHRWSHEIPFLWNFHAIHHSAEEVDFLVSTRAHPLDQVFSRICEFFPMYVLGLAGPSSAAAATTIPVSVVLFGMLWGYFIHANVRWRFGPLEWLITTPAFHHWHHTRTGPINHNYSSTLPWLDRLFGTHYLAREFPESYGIKAKLPDSLVGQLVYPLQPNPDQSAVVEKATTAAENRAAQSTTPSETTIDPTGW